jgi:hypothetical protein
MPERTKLRDIRVSADVEVLLEPAMILRLHQDAFARYGCCFCGEAGCTDEDPATVIVVRYRSGTSQVLLAHARCGNSQIVAADADRPEELSGEMKVRSTTAILSFMSAPTIRPLLLLEPLTDATALAEGSERVNLFLARMRDAGLTLVRTGEELPSWAEGWELRLKGRDAATLRRPDGTTEYEGECDQPDSWRQLVLGTGVCVMLLGQLGLYAVPDGEMTVERLFSLIDTAARAGELVGGIVMVREEDS